MDEHGRALQWLVRALARYPNGQTDLTSLHSGYEDERAPESLGALVRRAAAMGLVAYRGPDKDGHMTVWLTAQGEQALGYLQSMDEEEEDD